MQKGVNWAVVCFRLREFLDVARLSTVPWLQIAPSKQHSWPNWLAIPQRHATLRSACTTAPAARWLVVWRINPVVHLLDIHHILEFSTAGRVTSGPRMSIHDDDNQ